VVVNGSYDPNAPFYLTIAVAFAIVYVCGGAGYLFYKLYHWWSK
jgi:hypothetical protein